MIFKRRDTPGILARARALLAPRKGWRRGFEYIGRRVQRLPDTPHRIALGFACGAAASFTPLFGLHIAAGMLAALLLRGNVLASALGTVVGNPFTFPAIAAASIACGDWMLGVSISEAPPDLGAALLDYHRFLDTVFLPYLLGGLPLGMAAGAACYGVVRPLVAAYQARRRSRLVLAASERMRAHLKRRAHSGAGGESRE